VRLINYLRQLRYPVEFRVKKPIWPGERLSAFEKLITIREADKNSERETLSTEAIKNQFQFLGEIGTGLWRLKKKMVQPGTDMPFDEMRKAYRHFESVWDALQEAGIEIQDHTETPYDPGMSLKVIAFQPVKGIDREKVIETVKPSIYYKNHLLRMGEVIVGTVETP
jgi:hypothetical protein